MFRTSVIAGTFALTITSALADAAMVNKGWFVTSKKDGITDEVSIKANLISSDIDGVHNAPAVSWIVASCIDKDPIIYIIGPGPLSIDQGSLFEYRFSGYQGKQVPFDQAPGANAAAIINEFKIREFTEQAQKSDSLTVRLTGLRENSIIRFNAPNAKAALDKALNGCGWYKATP